ncbi:hypothetical protein FRC00_002745, partial [Tulasnella sp. 408]
LHEVAQGLTYLHEFTPPVVHGDIKPDNILIDDNGSALIIDFGLSRSVVESIPGFISSNRGAGNARWMAPELIEGGVPKSIEGDVYSFASLALNILTEDIPFSNFTNEVALILALASESPPSPASIRQGPRYNPALEAPVWKLLDECWATSPAERPTMGAVEERIQKLGRLDDALAEANGVNNPLPPTGNEDKGSAAKDKGQCDQHDIRPENENQATDEKPPPVAPPSSSFLVSEVYPRTVTAAYPRGVGASGSVLFTAITQRSPWLLAVQSTAGPLSKQTASPIQTIPPGQHIPPPYLFPISIALS